MLDAMEIAAMMAANAIAGDIQVRDIRYRIALADIWQIPPGAKILEIGCGQGDMTAVLASAVGPTGHITAVDIAGPDYGSPVTLGESATFLSNGPLGPRIDFRFDCDLLDPAITFNSDTFDLIVLAHGGWYFESLEQLRMMFERTHAWSKRFCFAEWDLRARSLDQVGHMLAVMIQGQIGAFHTIEESNVRTPFGRKQLTAMMLESGWIGLQEVTLDTSGLEDARWEIDNCLEITKTAIAEDKLPKKFLELIQMQQDLLADVSEHGQPSSLDSYVMSAYRND